jgi:hypothetical protein
VCHEKRNAKIDISIQFSVKGLNKVQSMNLIYFGAAAKLDDRVLNQRSK